MGHEPVGLRAVHGFQHGFLLGQCRVKLVVAAALLFQALDQGTQPVGSLEQLGFLCREQLSGEEGRDLFGQLVRQHGRHAGHAFPLHGLVGVAQGGAVILDRRGQVPGDDLRGIVVQRRYRHRFGAAGGAGVPPRDQAQGMGQQGSVAGVLTERLGPGGVHQAPAGDVLHAGQQGIERIQHGNVSSLRFFLHHTCPAGACQGAGVKKCPFSGQHCVVY